MGRANATLRPWPHGNRREFCQWVRANRRRTQHHPGSPAGAVRLLRDGLASQAQGHWHEPRTPLLERDNRSDAPQPSNWQGNAPWWDGEHDKFEDDEYSCMLYRKGSRRADRRYLDARLVEKLQGRARVWTKKICLLTNMNVAWNGS